MSLTLVRRVMHLSAEDQEKVTTLIRNNKANFEADPYIESMFVSNKHDDKNCLVVSFLLEEHGHWHKRLEQDYVKVIVNELDTMGVTQDTEIFEIDQYFQKCQFIKPLVADK